MSNTIIIAEAGVNHNGDIEIAKRLIDIASEAKVDYVKFQSFKVDKLVSTVAKKAKYQMDNFSGEGDTQYEMLKKLELSHKNHLDLISYCKKKEISFLSTAFDADGLDYLDSLGINLFKIPSGEITNYPYLKRAALLKKPIVISTGMASLDEIKKAILILTSEGLEKNNITVLHCNTEYPTPMKDVNLKAMNTIANELGVKVGYSDHTLGIEVPIAAVALGASMIEKHFTLDRNLEGPDHKASLEPNELKEMVESIRNIESALSGSGLKEPSLSEKKNINIARKSIHLKVNKFAGDVILEEDIIPLRPGDGISAIRWKDVLGKRLKNDKSSYDKLTWNDLI